MKAADIVAFEEGALSTDATIDMFADGIKSGLVWTLQGFYGRTARALIEDGYIDEQGNVLKYFNNWED